MEGHCHCCHVSLSFCGFKVISHLSQLIPELICNLFWLILDQTFYITGMLI